MSFDALAWAGRCQPGSAPRKLVLLALADRHNAESNVSYPSVKWLSDWTGLDRKTVMSAIDALEQAGLISDSGKRAGATGQVKAYTLHLENDAKSKQYQKRDTIPKTGPLNSTVFPTKQYQKRYTEPVKESVSIKSNDLTGKRGKPKFAFACPKGVDAVDWDGLIDNRRTKRAPMTEAAHRGILKKLETWAGKGWPPGPIVANAAERGWTTVFETDEMKGGGKPNHVGVKNDRETWLEKRFGNQAA